jgi:mono/diheme cytochrome c family protein/nitrate/TMAO reductase-like tetraheme cytochrome c subunit
MRKALRDFFFPPAGTPRWQRLLPYALLGALTLVVLVGGVFAWDYTNSPAFCGTACHTMPPEYTAYLLSPHAQVDCVECHIGRGFIATRVSRKAGDLEHVIDTAFRNYEFPIRARKMRPASDTCEKCHSPEKFSDDSLREVRRFGTDSGNTPTSTYLVLKTGGGSKREGLGRGIHWHIENPVYYLATDELDQEIPYVQVVNADGTTTEYLDINADLDPSSIPAEELKQMDCITCHNRITHLIMTPEDTVDRLISRGLISSSLPNIRTLAVGIYGADYASVEQGLQAIDGIREWYQQNAPEVAAQDAELIDNAIAALQDAYAKSHFPEQKVDHATHPNNIGHKDSPGCFRCHDGKHLSAAQEPIRLECNLCHSIPVVAGPPDFLANIEVSRGLEPSSHLDPSWIHLHRDVFDASCVNCHTTDDPGGVSNTSFCSNSACHGNVWEFAGFDAPGLREIVLSRLPATPAPTPLPAAASVTFDTVIGAVFEQRCVACHGGEAPIAELDLSSYTAMLEGSARGPVVVPGEPEASSLIRVQSGPQNHFGQLSPEELRLVTDWIVAGSPQ